jgi:DNA sulfur modification protein DndC
VRWKMSLTRKVAEAQLAIIKLFENKKMVCVAWSSGKDSSTVLSLVLAAAQKYQESGKIIHYPIVMTFGDVGIENPEISRYAYKEIEKAKKFCEIHNVLFEVHVAKPYLNDSWPVATIGGRALPVFANKKNRSCARDMKLLPQERLRKKILKRFPDVCSIVLLGTRYSESDSRQVKMLARDETPSEPWKTPAGVFALSPICEWSVDDVWEYLASCRDGMIKTYSNFHETFRLYSDASEEHCGAIADIFGDKSQNTACGSRFGCVLCTVTQDRSLKNMIISSPDEYGYLLPVSNLQQFLINTQYDLDRRHWIGRSIKNGHIVIGPDSYHPKMLEEIFLYCLTIDVEEQEKAIRLGVEPRFQLISAEQIIAIDAIWSQQGLHRPFHGLYLYKQVYVEGKRYPVPQINPFPVVKFPKPRYLQVGESWDETLKNDYLGLRNYALELVSFDSDNVNGCMGHKIAKNGRVILDCETDIKFNVDFESACLILDPDLGECNYLIDNFHNDSINPTYGYKHYITLGTIEVAKSKILIADNIIRRTGWKARHGLTGGEYSSHELIKKSKPLTQVPREGQPLQLSLC